MAEQVDEYLRRLEEARELRRRSADWGYIESRPEPLRTALKLLVETGDLWYSSKLSGVPVDELNEEREEGADTAGGGLVSLAVVGTCFLINWLSFRQ
jgi:hypothetical protein